MTRFDGCASRGQQPKYLIFDNLRRFAGVSEAQPEQESAGEILSSARALANPRTQPEKCLDLANSRGSAR